MTLPVPVVALSIVTAPFCAVTFFVVSIVMSLAAPLDSSVTNVPPSTVALSVTLIAVAAPSSPFAVSVTLPVWALTFAAPITSTSSPASTSTSVLASTSDPSTFTFVPASSFVFWSEATFEDF